MSKIYRSFDVSADLRRYLDAEAEYAENRPTCDCCGEKVMTDKMLRIFGKTICWDCVDEFSEYVED